ncbi:MAG: penicillin-binding transpeptidase domain-containing protein, partial [Planctomycetota bacterium]
DVDSGYVLAMLGGYSFDRSEFNRALQACRQPGSSFKPLVYAAALDLKRWTASSTVLDAPITFDDPSAQRRWKPKNFEVKFKGEVTLRTALQHSMNVPAIKVLHAVGLPEALDYAKKL